MPEKVVPMIHVTDVRATVDWYLNIGFTVLDTYGNEHGGLSFAILSFGTSQVMFSQGGQASSNFRREVDLYIYTNEIDELFEGLKDSADIIEGPHDTFYGMREFIIRDINRFWLTFGQPSVFGMLMEGVRNNNIDLVRAALNNTSMKPETLTSALAVASSDKTDPDIVGLITNAGGIAPLDVDAEKLRSYTGRYENEGFTVNVSCRNGRLYAAPGKQEPMILMAIDEASFCPIELDEYGILTFDVREGQSMGCMIRNGHMERKLTRISED